MQNKERQINITSKVSNQVIISIISLRIFHTVYNSSTLIVLSEMGLQSEQIDYVVNPDEICAKRRRQSVKLHSFYYFLKKFFRIF